MIQVLNDKSSKYFYADLFYTCNASDQRLLIKWFFARTLEDKYVPLSEDTVSTANEGDVLSPPSAFANEKVIKPHCDVMLSSNITFRETASTNNSLQPCISCPTVIYWSSRHVTHQGLLRIAVERSHTTTVGFYPAFHTRTFRKAFAKKEGYIYCALHE